MTSLAEALAKVGIRPVDFVGKGRGREIEINSDPAPDFSRLTEDELNLVIQELERGRAIVSQQFADEAAGITVRGTFWQRRASRARARMAAHLKLARLSLDQVKDRARHRDRAELFYLAARDRLLPEDLAGIWQHAEAMFPHAPGFQKQPARKDV